MPYLSPATLTRDEQRALLEASAGHPRDHLVFSMALRTGLPPPAVLSEPPATPRIPIASMPCPVSPLSRDDKFPGEDLPLELKPIEIDARGNGVIPAVSAIPLGRVETRRQGT
jgi:hypothetical protein